MNSRNFIQTQKSAIFKKKYLKINMVEIKKYCEFRELCHYTGENKSTAHSICNLNFSVLLEIQIVFHNGSNYDYHFIIKKPAEELEKQFTYLRQNISYKLQLLAYDLWQAHS